MKEKVTQLLRYQIYCKDLGIYQFTGSKTSSNIGKCMAMQKSLRLMKCVIHVSRYVLQINDTKVKLWQKSRTLRFYE